MSLDFSRILEIFIALVVFGVLFGIFFSIFLDSSIESVKDRLNGFKVDCSSVPLTNAIQISLEGQKLFCVVHET